MMNKEQKWVEKHPITWLLMQKIGEFLWFFAKFSVCMLLWCRHFDVRLFRSAQVHRKTPRQAGLDA